MVQVKFDDPDVEPSTMWLNPEHLRLSGAEDHFVSMCEQHCVETSGCHWIVTKTNNHNCYLFTECDHTQSSKVDADGTKWEKRELLNPYDTEKLIGKFIYKYGTDYYQSAKLGGKVSQQMSYNANTEKQITSSELQEASSASLEIAFFKAGTNSNTATSSSINKLEKKGVEVNTAKFEGGVPGDGWQAWCESVIHEPVPLSFLTSPIYSVLESSSGEIGMSTNAMLSIAEKLKQYITITLPKRIKSCVTGQEWSRAEMKCVLSNCPDGQILDPDTKDPAMRCQKCPAGEYKSAPASPICSACAAGRFTSIPGKSACDTCPTGFTSNTKGASCPYLKGSFNIKLGGKLLSEAGKDKGDGDIPSGRTSSRWAAWDTQNSVAPVTITHVAGDYYYIQKGTRYLSYTTEGDGTKDGCEYWAYWSTSKAEIAIIKNGAEYQLAYKNKQTGSHYGIKSTDKGDGTKQSGDWPWACFDLSKWGNVAI